jgi:hypothetical protein
MAAYVEDLASLFGGITHQESVENFDYFKIRYQITALNLPGDFEHKLSEILKLTSSRSLAVSLETENQNTINVLSSEYQALADKVSNIRDQLGLVDNDDSVFLEITVNKDQDAFLDVFSKNAFSNHLFSLTMQESFQQWYDCNQGPDIQINVWEETDSYSTNVIAYSTVYPNLVNQISTKESVLLRDEVIEKRDKCSHFANAAQFDFIPEDFLFFGEMQDEKIKRYFNGLYNAFLIICLSDFSTIEGNILKYRLKGYKVLSEKFSFNSLSENNPKELKAIFEWTYCEGNYIDKIGLARNIISIHLQKDTLLSLEDGTADSVESSYDLYLKENVKQYIDIKNKISEFLQGQSDKASDITKSMFAMFKTGLWTFTTFFISVFLLRIVSSKTFTGSISFDVLVVCLLLITFSFIYLLVATLELNADRDRLLNKYLDIRNRYKDLINKKDLDTIINETETKEKEEKYINSKRNTYALIWFLTNALLLIVVFFLYFKSIEQSIPEPEEQSMFHEEILIKSDDGNK